MANMTAIKLVVIGDGGVGKTSLLITFTTNSFPVDYIPTVFDNYAANFLIDGRTVNLGLWDTGGREESDRLRPLSYPQTDVFLVCFSLTSRPSLKNVSAKLVPEIKHHCHGVPFIVVGTKEDLREDPEVIEQLRAKGEKPITQKEGQELSNYVGASCYIEVSSKFQKNLKFLFDSAARLALLPSASSKKRKNGTCIMM
eukprot:Phypoly_transcript_15735.p1 GENE.Phypoly_transcript_15735~~Phypoly_transcript_15735.p1  ORF type:complete len:198 (+),score=35.83 Phypoly_transcript_15735:294-887(+)